MVCLLLTNSLDLRGIILVKSKVIIRSQGFTLIELLIVIAIMGILAVVVLVLINPAQQLARTRDTGRITTVTQLGHAIQSYYASRDASYPDPLQWGQDLINASSIENFPSGVRYNSGTITACTTNSLPPVDPTFCYDLDTSGAGFGAIVFSKLESVLQVEKCSGNGDTYFIFSSVDGRAGTICSTGDPVPWAPGTQTYLD